MIRTSRNKILLFAGFLFCVGTIVAQQSAVTIETLIRQSKFADAEKRIQQLLQKNPNDSHALILEGMLNRKEAKYGLAERALLAAMDANPASVEAMENLGTLYADEGRISEAIPLYEKAQTLAPHAPKVVTQLASLYMQNGEYERSLRVAESIPAASRPDKLLPIMIADYIGLKRTDDVQKSVPEVLRRAAADQELIPQLANVFLQGEMVGDARELLKLAEKREKPTASLLTAVANVQARSGHPEEAGATLRRALAMDPNNTDALWGAARLAGSGANWKLTVEYLKRMLRNAPPRPEILRDLVFAAMQVGDFQTAHDAAEDWQAIDHDSLDSVLAMSAVLISGLHWGEAEALVQKGLQRYPDDKRLHFAAGTVEFKLGKVDEAEPQLRAALGQGAADADVHYTLGQIEAQRGDIAAATEQMESALALNPKKPDVLFSLGQYYLQLNQPEKAKAALEQAVSLAPENAQNHYQLAMAYRRLGQTAEAQEQMKQFQQLSVRHVPESPGSSSTPR